MQTDCEGPRLKTCKQGIVAVTVAASILFLTACATVRPPPVPATEAAPPGWQERRQALLDIKAWVVNGRVAVRTEQEAWSASLHWTQHQDDYRLSIYGPFGQGNVKMHGDGRGGVLRLSDEQSYASRHMEQLLYDRLGWRIPVDSLRYWARGVPDPGAPKRHGFDDEGRLAWLEQFGWRVEYRRYTSLRGGLELPRKIDIHRRQLRLRLVIDQWKLPNV